METHGVSHKLTQMLSQRCSGVDLTATRQREYKRGWACSSTHLPGQSPHMHVASDKTVKHKEQRTVGGALASVSKASAPKALIAAQDKQSAATENATHPSRCSNNHVKLM